MMTSFQQKCQVLERFVTVKNWKPIQAWKSRQLAENLGVEFLSTPCMILEQLTWSELKNQYLHFVCTFNAWTCFIIYEAVLIRSDLLRSVSGWESVHRGHKLLRSIEVHKSEWATPEWWKSDSEHWRYVTIGLKSKFWPMRDFWDRTKCFNLQG